MKLLRFHLTAKRCYYLIKTLDEKDALTDAASFDETLIRGGSGAYL